MRRPLPWAPLRAAAVFSLAGAVGAATAQQEQPGTVGALVAEAAETFASNPRGIQVPEAQLRAAFHPPAFLAPATDLVVCSDGLIWLRQEETVAPTVRWDVLELPSVDAGDGWLIFGLPPAEVAVHPAKENDVHEFYLMCDDVTTLVRALAARGVHASPVQEERWGSITRVALPRGGTLGRSRCACERHGARQAGRPRVFTSSETVCLWPRRHSRESSDSRPAPVRCS